MKASVDVEEGVEVENKQQFIQQRVLQIRKFQTHHKAIKFVQEIVEKLEPQEAVAALYQICYRNRPEDKARFRKSNLLYKVMRKVFNNMETLTALELSHVLSSLAVINLKPPLFMQRFENATLQQLPQMNSIDISLMVYNYSQLKSHPGNLMDKALLRAVDIINTFDAKSLSTILQGLADLQHKDEDFLAQIIPRFKQFLPNMLPFPIASSVQALGKLHCYDEPLMNDVKSQIIQNLDKFSPHQICMVVWGFTRINYHPQELFDLIVEQFSNRSRPVKSIDVATIIWAMGHFGYIQIKDKCDKLVVALRKDKIREMSGLTVANTLWGLALIECYHLDVFQTLMDQAEVLFKRNQLDPTLLRQIFQSYMISKDNVDIKMDSLLKAEGCKWWISALYDFDTSPAFKLVERDLKRLEVEFKSDVFTEDNLLRIDFVLTDKNSRSVALQITGLYERALNTYSLLGSPQASNRLLENQNYKVVTLNGWKYAQKYATKRQLYFLEQFLRETVQIEIPEGSAKRTHEKLKERRRRIQQQEREDAWTTFDGENGQDSIVNLSEEQITNEKVNEQEGVVVGLDWSTNNNNQDWKLDEKDDEQNELSKKLVKDEDKMTPRIGLPPGLRIVRSEG